MASMLMKKDCGKLLDSSCCNPPLNFDSCDKFDITWSKICNKVPEGTLGNGSPKVVPPYGYTPMPLPDCPYTPKTMSLARPPWEGWRYGENYMHTDGIRRPYGFPDYQYYRKNYCGPCCSCVCESMPGGDPDGKNPDIRYVQLDFKDLLGSGFAKQGPPQSQSSPYKMEPGAATSCGRNHCPECSGVYKKKDQPVKFQVCIGSNCEPETNQPCPNQPMKIYVPLSMLPRGGPDGDKADDDDDCGGGNEGEGDSKYIVETASKIPGTTCGSQLMSMEPQQFEVNIPGEADAYHGGRLLCCYPPAPEKKKISCNNTCSTKPKTVFDPCGCCKACVNPPKFCTQTSGLDPTRCQFLETRKPEISYSKPVLPCARPTCLTSVCQ